MFKPEQARSPVSTLSGGERNRLLLALSMATSSNFMILDEPTNDLDMDTLDRLQDMLSEYQGTILLVSHDRSFLDNVVTSTIVMEGDGKLQEYAGGYKDYLRQSKKKTDAPEKPLKNKEKQQAKADAARRAERSCAEKPKERPKKLSFKHEFALKELPKKMAALDVKIKKAEQELSDPDLYLRDSIKAETLAHDLKSFRVEKDCLENDWLEVELLREEIEAVK